MTLKECIERAGSEGKAVGHFNFATIEGLHAIADAARELGVPVIVGNAEGEENFVGTEEAVALVKTIKGKYSQDIFLNADHHYSFESVKKCIDAGYDMVIVDGAKLSKEENIALTKQCVEYARAHNPEVVVEAELGYIGQASQILDSIPEGVGLSEAELTSAEDAKSFVKATGIDALAPSVGNVHGMLRNVPDPDLNIARIKEISQAVSVPLVLHGASGNSDADIKAAIEAGISVVHVNTELRRAWKDSLEKHLSEYPDDIAPYKVLKESAKAMYEVVKEKLKIFNGLN